MAQTFFPITPTEITAGSANEFVTMDASALAPANATGVILHIVNTAAAERNVGIRKNGSTDDRHPDQRRGNHCWAMIGVDASRYFEAYVESTTDIDIYVVGYTMAGVTFATNATEKSPDETGSWRTVDCSTEAPSAIGLIFEIENVSTAGGYQFGLKKNGSTDDRHYDNYFRSNIGAIIGCDASQIYEGYIEDTDLSFFLVGYITDGATFNTNATDVSLGSTGSFIDLTALPDVTPAPNMGFIEVAATTNPYNYGLRKDGSGEDIVLSTYYHPWGIVECASRIIEGEISDTSVDFFVVGYSTEAAAVIQQAVGGGSITPVGALGLKTMITTGQGAITPTGALNRLIKIATGSGAITPAGVLGRLIKIAVGSGSITPVGVLTAVNKFFQNVGQGAITAVGTLGRKIALTVGAGAITPAGALNRLIKIAVGAGAVTPTGALTAVKRILQAVGSGSITIVGTLGRKIKLAVGSGAITPAGVLGRLIKIAVGAGAITPAGALGWKFMMAVGGGAVAIVGTLGRKISISVGQGAVAIAGTLQRYWAWIKLTLPVRSLALTLQHRAFALTLPVRSLALTLQHRVTALTLRVRSLALTLPWRKTK